MSRIILIDSIRGFSFIPMFIFHIFSTYDLTNNFNTMTSANPIVSFLGQIRNVFIILAGISLSLSALNKKDNTSYYSVRIKRSIQILIHALLLSVLTKYLFPGFEIKFGILHFIGIATILLAPIASNNILLLILLLMCFIKIPNINPTIDTILGTSVHYNMADWFPLKTNLPLIISGVLLGNVMFDKTNKAPGPKEQGHKESVLEWMGKNSLDLYTGHVVLLILVFYIAKHYFHMY